MEQNLTFEELQALKEIQDENSRLVKRFGEIEIESQNLKITKSHLENQFQKLKNKEKKVGNYLSKKYGDGQIFLSSGKIVTSD